LQRRVVVTGVGLLTSVGIGTEPVWDAIKRGQNGIGPITAFDASQFKCRIAGEVKGFEPADYIEKKEIKKMGRFIQFAIAATEFAIQSSGFKVNPEEAERTGVYIGSGIGGFEVIEREHKILLEQGPDRMSPFFIPATIINLASGYVSIRTGAKGPNSATATACTTSANAIGDSFRIIRYDDADVMICGGTEACITPLAVGGFRAMRALSQRNDEPHRASRPWDKMRDGFVIGEGAGILILEELEHARRRGANIVAEIVGYGMSADAHHITSPPDDGDGAYRVMRAAIRDAKIQPHQIDYINAHGTSTDVGDRVETIAVKRVFGEHARKIAVSSTKSMTGHLLGGAGGLEAGISILAIRDQIAPPTINYECPDPDCDLDYVPNHARPMKIDYVLSNSFGFGGTNGCLIFKKFEAAREEEHSVRLQEEVLV
jgi:3-oxoacyl-[acyl-carrier-protein] synthase II